MLQNKIYKYFIYYLKFIFNDFLKIFNIAGKFKEIGGHHEEKLKVKTATFLTGLPLSLIHGYRTL